MNVLSILPLLLLSSPASGAHAPGHGDGTALAADEEPRPRDAAELSLAELVARLPPAGREGRVAAEGGATEEPVVVELRKRLRSGTTMADELWRRAIAETGALAVRPRWPAGEPFAVSMYVPSWLGPARILAKGSTLGLSSATREPALWCGTDLRASRYQQVGWLEPGRHALTFVVNVRRGLSLAEPRHGLVDEILWRGKVEFDVEVVPNLEDVVLPVSDAALDVAVRECVSLTFREQRNPCYPPLVAELRLAVDPERQPRLIGLGLSFEVELLRDGEPVSREDLPPRSVGVMREMFPGSGRRLVESFPLSEITRALYVDVGLCPRWTLRVTGTSRDVLALWDAERRWAGSFDVSVNELLTRGAR